MKIWSVEDCQYVLDALDKIKNSYNLFFENFNNAINTVHNSEIIQGFYASGPRGQQREEQMVKLHDGLSDYNSIISDENGLITTTRRLVEDQLNILNSNSSVSNNATVSDRKNATTLSEPKTPSEPKTFTKPNKVIMEDYYE